MNDTRTNRQLQTRPPGARRIALVSILALGLCALLLVPAPQGFDWRLMTAALLFVSIASVLISVVIEQRRGIAQILTTLNRLAQLRTEERVNTMGLRAGALSAAEACNAVAERLAELHSQLDTQVAERTQRLRQERDSYGEQNQKLRSAAAQARDEARAQSELLSSLSHELRTPLTGILGYAGLLRRSGLNAEQSLQLDTLEKSGRALLAMINDLLDWSRIEAGRLRLTTETFAVLDTVEDTCALLAPLAYDKGLELVPVVYHDVPRQLRGDPQRLQQILTNLLSNAIKFTTSGEIVIRVMREREDAGRAWIRFSISDTGVGISAEQQQRLFQPYRQVGRPSHGGSGLGLSITRKLTELMGGEIGLDSIVGQGSTFSVLLPFKLNADAESAPTHDPRLAHKQIWLHEPHPIARLALVHWLEFWGMQVRTFESMSTMAATLERAGHATMPDLVIVGLKGNDPDVDLASLTQSGAAPPLLALVASASPPALDRLRDAGAAACHPKSLGRQRLHDELLRLALRGGEPAPLPLRGRVALVADNNLANRRYLVALCQGLGLETLDAADGAEALRCWRRERPPIVLLDAQMPQLSGIECAHAIRTAEAETGSVRCRIIAISAHLEPDERTAFTQAGADAILLKPFDERELLRIVDPTVAGPQPVAAKLTDDPELLQLLQEELPHQLSDLERAMAARDLSLARDAAHTLRGTAAFYHLPSLRQTASALEQWLLRTTALQSEAQGRRELDSVRRAVVETLDAISADVQSPRTSPSGTHSSTT